MPNSSLIEPEPVLMHRFELKSFNPPAHPLVVRAADVVQGQIAACPIAAVMVATAHARPDRIQALLGPPQAGVVLSKRRDDEIFRFWSSTTYQVRFRRGPATTVTPVVYYDDRQVAYARTQDAPGWPSLVEKAYAIWRGGNSYNGLNQGTTLGPPPDAQMVLEDLSGPSDMADIIGGRFFPNASTERALTDTDLSGMANRGSRRPTIAGSLLHGTTRGVVSNHAYAVLRWRNGRVVLRNPWGGPGAEVTLTLTEIRANFRALWQAA